MKFSLLVECQIVAREMNKKGQKALENYFSSFFVLLLMALRAE